MGHFGSELWIGSKNFFKILQNERGLAFRPFFTVLLGMVKLSRATVNWILKQSGQDFFHDYYWILEHSGHD